MANRAKGGNANTTQPFAAPVNTQDDCPLFNLPGELRNTIYSKLFEPHDFSNQMHDLLAPSPPKCTFMLSCQQILAESKSHYAVANDEYWSRQHFYVQVPDEENDRPDHNFEYIRDAAIARLVHVVFVRASAPSILYIGPIVVTRDGAARIATALDSTDGLSVSGANIINMIHDEMKISPRRLYDLLYAMYHINLRET